MRQLLLLRHAKALPEDAAKGSGKGDHGRPLTVDGQESAAAMAAAMRRLGLAPDVVLVSSSRRTRQTLEALGPWEDAPLIETMDALYLASAPQILAVLHKVTETVRGVMVIGHNPGLHEAALMLMGKPATEAGRRLAAGLPTSGLAEFTVAGRWADLGEGGGRLVRFLAPDDLREPAR